jgi:hypothetical protein
MYRNAMDGNLYYYNVGQDMPQRLSADGEQATAQQLKKPVEPKLWQKIINTITFGYFFDDICHPQPDRDPQAMEGILRSSDGRTAIITVEIPGHRAIQERDPAQVEQVRHEQENRINDEVANFRRIPDANARREFPVYEQNAVKEKLNAVTNGVLGHELNREKEMTYNYVNDRLGSQNPEQCREAMAALVLMEGIKLEHLAGGGNGFASQVMGNHDNMVKSMLQNDIFQAFTKDASAAMLDHFIMVDGARNMYQTMQDIAENRAEMQALNDSNVMEHSMQNQANMQMPGFG